MHADSLMVGVYLFVSYVARNYNYFSRKNEREPISLQLVCEEIVGKLALIRVR